MHCEATTKAGAPCRAPVRPNSGFCFWHSPELATERLAARSKGGTNAHGGGESGHVRIRQVADLLDLLEIAAGDAMSREPSISRARCLCQVAQTAGRVLEVADLEARVVALEERQTKGVT
jgi:hypothetical protein